jgi:hypothetical protein
MKTKKLNLGGLLLGGFFTYGAYVTSVAVTMSVGNLVKLGWNYVTRDVQTAQEKKGNYL